MKNIPPAMTILKDFPYMIQIEKELRQTISSKPLAVTCHTEAQNLFFKMNRFKPEVIL